MLLKVFSKFDDEQIYHIQNRIILKIYSIDQFT
jgi:hypothetical protein